MNADDLQEIYNSIRGSRSAMAVMDAKTQFLEKNYEEAFAKLSEAHQSYSESRHRILRQEAEKSVDPNEKDAERQIRRMKRKQEKAREIIAKFEEVLPVLEKKAMRANSNREAIQAKSSARQQSETVRIEETVSAEEFHDETDGDLIESPPEPVRTAEPEDRPSSRATGGVTIAKIEGLRESFLDQFQESWGQDQLEVVGNHYDFQPVRSIADVFNNAMYYLFKNDDSLLVMTVGCSKDNVQLVNVLTDEELKPLPTRWFLELGADRTMVLLLEKDEAARATNTKVVSTDSDDQAILSDVAHANPAPPVDAPDVPQAIDADSLSQLMESALRSGLIPAADQISAIRDGDFLQGRFDAALLSIESLYDEFTAAADSRTARLEKQDDDIASGQIKISEKQLQSKRKRDEAQNRAIDDSRRQFVHLMKGLRGLAGKQNQSA